MKISHLMQASMQYFSYFDIQHENNKRYCRQIPDIARSKVGSFHAKKNLT